MTRCNITELIAKTTFAVAVIVALCFINISAFAEPITKSNTFTNGKYPEPPKGHPRLIITKDKIPELQIKLNNAKYEKEMDTYKYLADKFFDGNLPTMVAGKDTNAEHRYLKIVEAKIIKYLISQDIKDGKELINIAKNLLVTMDRADGAMEEMRGGRWTGYGTFLCAVIYDWCYDIMSSSDKDTMLVGFQRMTSSKLMYKIPLPDSNKFPFVGFYNEEIVLYYQTAIGIALYDEEPLYYNDACSFLLNINIPGSNYVAQANMQTQGAGYASRYMSESINNFLFKSIGYDFYRDEEALVPYRSIYTLRPDGALFTEGDTYPNYTFGPWDKWTYPENYFWAAAISRDPYIKQLFNSVYNFTEQRQNTFWYLLLDDPDIKAKSFQELPKSMYFGSPYGSMVTRTGWDMGKDSNDVIAVMNVAEKHFANHQHKDSGAFSIYYKGMLALDSGLYGGTTGDYGSDHDYYYHKQSIAHNVLKILDTSNKIAGVPPDGQQSGIYYLITKSMEELRDGTKYDRARVLAHSMGDDALTPDYSYIKANLTPSYVERVNGYDRSMVFLNLNDKNYPAVMITYDNIDAVNDRQKPVWVIHSQEEPNLTGNSFSITNSRDNYGGELIVNTVLPSAENIDVKKIGGPGHEFEVEGKNYPQEPRTPGLLDSYEGGKWRVEVSPKTLKQKDVILNIMQVQDSNAPKKKMPIFFFENGDMQGITVADRAVFFSKVRENVDKETTISFEGKRTYKVLVTDLAAGFWSIAKEGEQATTQYEVTEDGNCLYFMGESGKYVLTPSKEKTLELAPKVSLTDDQHDIRVRIEGQPFRLSTQAQMVDGRVLVPMRSIFETLSATVEWNGDTQTVTATKDDISIKITIGENKATLNGKEMALDVPATMIDGFTMVPLRFVSESLGASVSWDESEQIVDLGFQKEIPKDKFLAVAAPNNLVTLAKNEQREFKVITVKADPSWLPENAPLSIDGNLTTSSAWVGKGDGAWIEYDLGKNETLYRVDLMYVRGNERANKINISVSEDGKKFTYLYGGTNAGDTIDYNQYNVKPTNCRYIRITGFGSPDTLSPWTSIIETKFYGKK